MNRFIRYGALLTAMGTTSIHLDPDTRDRLRSMKKGSETYDDVITRLLEEAENNE